MYKIIVKEMFSFEVGNDLSIEQMIGYLVIPISNGGSCFVGENFVEGHT